MGFLSHGDAPVHLLSCPASAARNWDGRLDIMGIYTMNINVPRIGTLGITL